MEATIIVAIIGSISAVIVAVVSTIRASRANKELELYKYRLETTKQRDEMSRAILEKRLDITGQVCTALQKLRDDLRRLKMASDNDYELAQNIRDAAKQLQKLYQQHFYSLAWLEREFLHSTKDIGMMLETDFQVVIDKKRKLSDTSLVRRQLVEAYLESLETAQKIFIKEFEKLQEILTQLPEPIRDGKYQPLLTVKDTRFISYAQELERRNKKPSNDKQK